METEASLISDLIKVGPVVSVLLLVIKFMWSDRKELRTDNSAKDVEIKELNKELRDSAVEQISLGKDINNTLKELITELKTN